MSSYEAPPTLLDTPSFYDMPNIRLTIYRLLTVAGNESYNERWLIISAHMVLINAFNSNNQFKDMDRSKV